MTETLKQIKADFRANMNGVASAHMRESGLKYHVNFGIELPRLQEIMKEYQPSHELAQQLWMENVRESKIAAAMLMMRSAAVLVYYPVLLISGGIAGTFTGVCAQLVLRRQLKRGEKNKA